MMKMNMKTTLGAAAFLLASGSIASAAPAVVEADLNVRTGPGTGYAVVDVLPGGITVDAIACYSGWCEVSWEGRDGFASRAYLDIISTATILVPPPNVAVVPGVVVYERSYWDRPVWDVAGRVIRRELRQDARQDRREHRREVRQDRREYRRDVRQDRRQDVRQERRQDARQDARQDRRRDARHERRQDIRQDRREVRHDARQERRHDARQDRRHERRQEARQRAHHQRSQAHHARAEQRRNARQERRAEQ
jgi:uncharacterized protein YraI